MKTIKGEDLPYNDLENAGLSRNLFWNLPQGILHLVLNECLSPLMNFHIENASVIGKMGLKWVDDKVELTIYPRMNEPYSDIDLTKREMNVLANYGILRKKIDGVISFMQLDNTINTVLSVPVKCVYIPQKIEGIELTKEDLRKLKDGNVLEQDGLAMGIDLLFNKGFRVEKGTEASWRKVEEINYDAVVEDELSYWCVDDSQWKHINSLSSNIKR